MKFLSKEAQHLNIVVILNSTQQTGSVFMMPLGQKDFVQTPSKVPFNYHFGYGCFWDILFLAKHALNTKNDSIEEGDVDNCLGKKDFTSLVKDATSSASFTPSRNLWVKWNDVTNM